MSDNTMFERNIITIDFDEVYECIATSYDIFIDSNKHGISLVDRIQIAKNLIDDIEAIIDFITHFQEYSER